MSASRELSPTGVGAIDTLVVRSQLVAPGLGGVGDVGANVTNTLNQTIPSGVATLVTFDTERYDSGNLFAIGNPTRLTAPSTGKYLVGLSIGMSIGVAGVMSLRIIKNGVFAPFAVMNVPILTTSVTQAVVTMEMDLVAGDFVEGLVFQDSGADQAINVANGTPVFWARKVA